MIIVDKKKPISALKLIHTTNHTQINRFCDIHNEHYNIIKTLDYTIGERIYSLKAGLYKIVINNIEYIIDVYFDIFNGDFLVIKSEYDIKLYMAGSTPYNIIPYKINSIKDITFSCDIETINDNIDIIMIAGDTNYIGDVSLNNPGKINRISNININTESNLDSYYSLNIPLKHTLGSLPNGSKDYIVINADQLIAHDIINTTKEILSGSLDWQYKEEYSDQDYYVFFAKYQNVKLNNTPDSIRCSHFESVSCDELINKSTRKNCIATSYGSYGNGIWIKIEASVLDIHGNKDFGNEMSKWIFSKATSDYPIYIEYEISKTVYNTILIDEYHIKTWYPKTTAIIADSSYGFSVFYKALKSL